MEPIMIYNGTRGMNLNDLLIGHFNYEEDSRGRPVTDVGRLVRRVGENRTGKVNRFHWDQGANIIYAEILYVGANDMTEPIEVPQNEFLNYEIVSG